MFEQRGKTRDEEGDVKDKEQINRINLDHITGNDCEAKGQYAGKNECPTQTNLKEDAEALSKMKQE